jgi:hypothetical protein
MKLSIAEPTKYAEGWTSADLIFHYFNLFEGLKNAIVTIS